MPRQSTASTCVAPPRSALASANGSDTDPSTQRRPAHSTGGPASSGIVALARSACFQSSTVVIPVSVSGVRSATSVATTCSRPAVCPSAAQFIGLTVSSTRTRCSSATTGRRVPSRRMLMNVSVHRSSG